MKYSLPPFNEKEKRGFIEEKVLDFSNQIFRTPLFGIILSIFLNLLFLHMYFRSRSVISILFYLYFIYLVISLLLARALGLKRNK